MNQFPSLSTFSAKTGAALLLVAIADFLFFEQPIGISTAIFAAVLVAATVAVHPTVTTHRGRLALSLAIAVAAIAPLFENISGLSIVVAVLGLSVFALAVSGRLATVPVAIARQLGGFLISAPVRLVGDTHRARTMAARIGRAGIRFASLAVWVMPVILGAVFLALFGIANPIIDHWIALIDPWILLDLLDVWRLIFWFCVAVVVWAVLRPRLPRWLRRPRAIAAAANLLPKAEFSAAAARADVFFGKAAILRSLIVFNALFAVQTVLDAAYLWGGVALPEDLSYAEYAHRGAYPLIVTALLAAFFVLVAMRPGSATSADRRVRTLVYLWTAQNVALVISSMLRLDLYISVYSLTYLRVAAFIWMGLVAVGLVLIMARIAGEKSNEWLLGANLLTLSSVLYACCFINFAAMIATYNVTHSEQMTNEGSELDVPYLNSLGPAAIPAMDMFLDGEGGADATTGGWVLSGRDFLARQFADRQKNWRAWSFRDWRLGRYLANRQQPILHGRAKMPTVTE